MVFDHLVLVSIVNYHAYAQLAPQFPGMYLATSMANVILISGQYFHT